MWEVVIALLLICIVAYDINGRTYLKNGMYWLLWGVMTAMSAFAYNIGVDIMNAYQPHFEEYLPTFKQASISYILSPMVSRFEPGYVLFAALCKSIIPSWYFMKLVFAAITNLVIFNLIKRYTPHLFSVLLLYFVLIYPMQHFGYIRQTMAIWFMVLAFEKMHKKQWGWGILFLICAYPFHTSALILLVTPFFFIIGNNFKRFFWIFAVLGLLFLIFHRTILNSLPTLLPTEYAINKFYRYYEDENRQREFNFITILHYVLNIGIPLLTIHLLHRKGSSVEYIPEIFIASTFLLINLFVPFFSRINNYVDIYRYMLWVEFFYVLIDYLRNDAVSRFAKFALVVGYAVIMGYNIYFSHPIVQTNVKVIHVYHPYSSVLTKNMPIERQYLYNVRID